MNEDLARSERPTARGGWLRPRSRLAPGPLRQGSLRQPAPGIARGMVTGALLGIGVLAAFTLPFLREGPAPAASAKAVRQAGAFGADPAEAAQAPVAQRP